MSNNIRVRKSITVTAAGIDIGEIIADLSTDDIIVLSVFDGNEDRSITIDRDVFKEFITTIEEV